MAYKHTVNKENVFINVNKVILGYISAMTKTDAKMVMVNLRDLANVAVERLRSRANGYSTWTNVKYPGTDLTIRATCDATSCYQLMQNHREEHEKMFQQATGITKPKTWKKQHASGYFDKMVKWQSENPSPYKDYDYQGIVVTFDIKGRQSYVTMSQQDIDNVLVEDILLSFSEGDDEEAK